MRPENTVIGVTDGPVVANQLEGALKLEQVIEAASTFGIDLNWFASHSQTHRYELRLPGGPKGIIEHAIFEKASVVICSYIPATAPVNTDQAGRDFETWVMETFAEIHKKAPSDYSYGFELGEALVWIKPHGVEEAV